MVEDGLASNGPHVRLLKELDMSFLLGAKPGDHKALFAWVDELESAPHVPGSKPGVERWETKDADGGRVCRSALGAGSRTRRSTRKKNQGCEFEHNFGHSERHRTRRVRGDRCSRA